jgi:hypothetical protein
VYSTYLNIKLLHHVVINLVTMKCYVHFVLEIFASAVTALIHCTIMVLSASDAIKLATLKSVTLTSLSITARELAIALMIISLVMR